MKHRSTLALLLLTAMLASLAACGGSSPSADTTASAGDNTTTAAPETASILSPNVPETDLGGYELRIGAYQSENGKYFWTEESNGEVVNDAVYNSLQLVQETFNMKVTPVFYGDSKNNIREPVVSSVNAGDDTYDLVQGHDGTMWQMSMEGYFNDVRALEYVDFSQPWFPPYANDSLELGGKQYLFTSMMSYESIEMMNMIYVNKTIAEEFKLGVPYQDVYDGKWTLDKMLSMAKTVYRDIDGDGERDETDLYGFLGYKKLYGFQGSFVACYVDDGKKVSMDYNKERLIDVIDRMNKLFNGGEGGYLIGNEPDVKPFLQEQGLFYYQALSALSSMDMRASNVNYGLLPVPKYDEKQANYVTPAFDNPFAIPVTAKNHDKLGIALEALASSGYHFIRPAFFETALSTKYTRDDDSIEMLRIAVDTMTIDLAYMNTPYGTSGLGRAMMYCLSNPEEGIASYLDSIKDAEQAIIDNLNTNFFGK